MKSCSVIKTDDYQPFMGRAYRLGDHEVIVESDKVPESVDCYRADVFDFEESRAQWPEDWGVNDGLC